MITSAVGIAESISSSRQMDLWGNFFAGNLSESQRPKPGMSAQEALEKAGPQHKENRAFAKRTSSYTSGSSQNTFLTRALDQGSTVLSLDAESKWINTKA